MVFFEPLPAPEPDARHAWAAPLWDRPSEGIIPAVVPVGAVLHRGDSAALALQYLGVYPNGFTINLFLLSDPHDQQSSSRLGMGVIRTAGLPRIGVRFSDGRVGGQGVGYAPESEKDADGVPTQPIVRMTGGGGSSHGFHFGAWVFPLPPVGPVDIFVSLAAIGVDEAQVSVDGTVIRDAAKSAHVLWT